MKVRIQQAINEALRSGRTRFRKKNPKPVIVKVPRVKAEPKLRGPRGRPPLNRPAPTKPMKSSVVYFAECAGYVKIGFSANLTRRVDAVRMGRAGIQYPMSISFDEHIETKLVAHFPGNRASEFAAHIHFARWRDRGEWFIFDEYIRKTISDPARMALILSGEMSYPDTDKTTV